MQMACPSELCPLHPYRLAGYKTDNSTLIPVKNLPEYEEAFEDSEEKIAV